MFRYWPFVLIFFSGLAALSYQMIWMREFRLIFGASTAATAAVSAIFMAGLGLGGWLLGPKADKCKQPLLMYGYLELAISVFALLFPVLLYIMRAIYLQSGGILALGLVGGTLARLVLAIIVIGVPTFLMGGTLPAVAKVVTQENDSSRLSLGTLYGVNTIGALAGTLLTTFFVMEAYGARYTLYLAVAINVIVALTAINLVKKRPAPVVAAIPEPVVPAKENVVEAGLPAPLALTAAAVVGFAFFLMELVWYRMLGPVLGGSVYTFGLILATALAGIGIGGAIHPKIFRRRNPSVWFLAATCILEALAIMAPYAIGDYLPALAAQTRSLEVFGFFGLVSSWTVITIIVVLPASIISGIQFPLLISLLGKGGRNLGRQTGITYACNTGGSIVGSLAGGFGLMPWLTAPGCWRLVGVLLMLLGLVLIGYGWRKTPVSGLVKPRRSGATAFFAGALILTVLCFTALGPTAAWRHSPVGSGRIGISSSINVVRNWMTGARSFNFWEADGVESSVSISSTNGYSFIVNGKSDGNVIGDKGTQIMVGLVGAALHPQPRRSLVIGLGTGCTAGWLAVVPGMEHVDVVELEPAVIQMARLCAPANYDVVSKAEAGQGVRIIINDAREVLNTIKAKYDLIVSEPSNPYRAGIASLYTKEFYTEVANRLNEDGIFLSWCQAYEIETLTAFTVVATLKTVFPYVECWATLNGDMLFVASAKPLNPDLDKLAARLNGEPYKEAMRIAWGTEGLNGFLSHFMANNAFTDLVSKAIHPKAINTDDLMLVEYAYANTVGKETSFSIRQFRGAAEDLNMEMPDWATGVVDKEAVYYTLGDGIISGIGGLYTPKAASDDWNVYISALHAWAAGDKEPLIAYWQYSDREPVSSSAKMALAECLAWNGDPQALLLLDGQDEFWPASVGVIKAIFAYKTGAQVEAVTELANALLLLRDSPWEISPTINRGLLLAVDLAQAGGSEDAARLYAAMEEPFCLSAMEFNRRMYLLSIASVIGIEKRLETLLRWFEPNPVWEESLLTEKVVIYSITGHPNLKKAQRDLDLYLNSIEASVADLLAQQR